jgi:hypothetical protein
VRQHRPSLRSHFLGAGSGQQSNPSLVHGNELVAGYPAEKSVRQAWRAPDSVHNCAHTGGGATGNVDGLARSAATAAIAGRPVGAAGVRCPPIRRAGRTGDLAGGSLSGQVANGFSMPTRSSAAVLARASLTGLGFDFRPAVTRGQSTYEPHALLQSQDDQGGRRSTAAGWQDRQDTL